MIYYYYLEVDLDAGYRLCFMLSCLLLFSHYFNGFVGFIFGDVVSSLEVIFYFFVLVEVILEVMLELLVTLALFGCSETSAMGPGSILGAFWRSILGHFSSVGVIFR